MALNKAKHSDSFQLQYEGNGWS